VSTHYGPVVPVRTQLRIAPWFLLLVVAYGVLDDHSVFRRALDGMGESSQPKPSSYAQVDIPPSYLAAYQRAAESCPGLEWTVLAAVGKVESDHGRSRLPGVRSGANSAGAAGPMQIGIGGKAGDTWAAYGDGVRAHVYQIGPAARAAARKLCRDGARSDVSRALFAYNHSRSYVARVRSIARSYHRRGA
jgi:hypothetical protein